MEREVADCSAVREQGILRRLVASRKARRQLLQREVERGVKTLLRIDDQAKVECACNERRRGGPERYLTHDFPVLGCRVSEIYHSARASCDGHRDAHSSLPARRSVA